MKAEALDPEFFQGNLPGIQQSFPVLLKIFNFDFDGGRGGQRGIGLCQRGRA